MDDEKKNLCEWLTEQGLSPKEVKDTMEPIAYRKKIEQIYSEIEPFKDEFESKEEAVRYVGAYSALLDMITRNNRDKGSFNAFLKNHSVLGYCDVPPVPW